MAKSKKIQRKKVSPEVKKRRSAARARLASMIGIAGLCVGVIALVRVGSTTETPLNVDASGYNCLVTEVNVIQDGVVVSGTNSDGEIVTTEPTIQIDEKMLAVGKINPKLRESYPIDMIISSEYAIVYDVEADEVLYAKNAEEKCYPASTTKILTSAVVLNNVDQDFVFTVGDELDMVNAGSSLAMIGKGNQLDTGMMIDALMLPSGNDAAYSAAANVGRVLGDDESLSPAQSVQNFVDEMNRTAMNIGCENTHFANPDGFHDDKHYTTVMDMLKITLYGEKFDMLMESAGKTDRYVTLLSGEVLSWENSNKLIHDYSDCYYMYATGMKTGMTDEAGYCVVATAERFGHQIVCIVFGAEASNVRWNDTIALLDAAFVQVRNRG